MVESKSRPSTFFSFPFGRLPTECTFQLFKHFSSSQAAVEACFSKSFLKRLLQLGCGCRGYAYL